MTSAWSALRPHAERTARSLLQPWIVSCNMNTKNRPQAALGSDPGEYSGHEVRDVARRLRGGERGYSPARAVARTFRQADQPIPRLVSASLPARDAHVVGSSRQYARTQSFGYGTRSFAAQAARWRKSPRSAQIGRASCR